MNYIIRLLTLLLIIAVVFIHSLFAGITGKIVGKVTDAQTGEPLIGVNVIIVGTMMGAATDMDGEYLIMNVPPGTYTLKAMMIGYTSSSVSNVKVSIDFTTTVNFRLSPSVVDLGEEVTVVAEREVIKKDMTSSLSSVSADEIASLPVQEVADVLELQAGLVRDPVGGIHIRGGRSGEVAFWVDGIAATDAYSGNLGVEIENVSIEELQVVSGTFNAEYGQAMSGIINIVTKEGGEKYHGELKAYVGDYMSNKDVFSILSRIDTVIDKKTGRKIPVAREENPLSQFNPAYNLQFSLSGPIPMLGNKVSFFTMGRYFVNDGWLYGRDWFKPQGMPGDSSLVPMNPFEKFSGQAKLTYRINSMMKLSYNIFRNSNTIERSFWHGYKYNPYGVPKQYESGYTHTLTWTHTLSANTFYEARFTKFYTDYKRYVYKDPLKTPHYWVRFPTDTTDYLIDLSTEAGQAEFENLRTERTDYKFFIDPNNSEGYVHPDSARSPTSYSFLRGGMDLSHFQRSSSYMVGKIDLTSQVTKAHQIKSGIEFRFHELTLDGFTIQPKREGGEEIVPFQPWVPPVSTIYHSKYVHNPIEISAYLQDKIEFKDMIVNIGLRYDYFDADGVVPADPSDPNIYEPIKPEHIYLNPNLPDSLINDPANIYSPDERRSFMHKKVSPKMQVSPRLGIAYPITDRGVIHFSYGHFFQIPLFEYLYANPDFKVSKGGGTTIVGNADLKPQKTVMYEIGLQQQLTDDIGFDVTMFYRDVRDWVSTSPLISTPIPSVKYSKYENKDYSNVRGVTLSLNKRYSHYFSANLDYSFMIAEGTYSNPTDAFNAIQGKQEPRLALIPLSWDQRHTINGSVSIGTESWRVSFIGRYWTGRPYTPSIPRAEAVGASAYIGFRDNSERLPSVNTFDVYLFKQFKVRSFNVSLFMNIYNVFDQKNETWVYTDTGSAEYSSYIDPDQISGDPLRVSTVEDYVKHPEWYTEPRQIQFGMTIGF